MNRYWYSAFLYLLTPLLLLYLTFRSLKSPAYRARWSERFGLRKLNATSVLVHTASMGETLAAIPLIRKIMDQYPHLSITITTTSPTGSEQVNKAFGDKVQHCYLPVDFAHTIRGFIKQLRPEYLIVLETELWPNLLHYASQHGTQIMLANGRLSEKSAQKYARWPKLTRPMLQQLNQVAVQTEVEAQRFIKLGVKPETINVNGNLKFDVVIASKILEEGKAIRRQWARQNAPVWIAGSVHPGEFASVIAAHQTILQQHPDSLLVMVPRHPEQFDAAAQHIQTSGLSLARRSQQQQVTQATQVVLGDTMGELVKLYATADCAFVGGSLIEHGGQNPIEPAAVGLKLIMGESQYNFTEICQRLQAAEALSVVTNATELAQALITSIEQQELCREQQQAARKVIAESQGAVDKQFHQFELLLATA